MDKDEMVMTGPTGALQSDIQHTVSIFAEAIKAPLPFGHKPPLLENLCQDIIDKVLFIGPDP